MLKYVVAMLCGVSLTGSVYMAGWGSTLQPKLGEACGDSMECCTPENNTMALDSKKELDSSKIDVKNTKCIVMGEDISTKTVEYQGKIYHICCEDCIETFNKTPEKFVKALE